MTVNGHFASAGQNGEANFEHGVQVIDEDKEFKCVHLGMLTAMSSADRFLKPGFIQVSELCWCFSFWIQLPPNFCLRIAVDRQIDPP